jgi:hypothetical protein
MDVTWVQVVGWSLPLVGVALGGYLSGQADARRWRRDWTIERVRESTTYWAEVVESVDAQFRLIGQCVSASRGERPAVPAERVETVDAKWGSVLARRGVSASPSLQDALSGFDQARGAAVEAANSHNAESTNAALTELEEARVAVLYTLRADQDAINAELAPLVLSRKQRVVNWRTRRRQEEL